VEAEKQAQRRLSALKASRTDLEDVRAAAARNLKDVSDALQDGHQRRLDDGGGSGTDDAHAHAHAILQKAKDLYMRMEARASQVQNDIAGVVDITQQVLTKGTTAQKDADRTLALAEALKHHVDAQQSCVKDAWGKLNLKASMVNHTDQLRQRMRIKMKKERQMEQNLTAEIKKERQMEQNLNHEINQEKQMESDLTTKEKADKVALQAKMKKVEEGLAHVWQKAKRQAGKKLDDARDIRQDAQDLRKKGAADLRAAHGIVDNNTRLKELADQEMRDALSVMKGLDPDGKQSLHQAFRALQNASDILAQARHLCAGKRVLVKSPGSAPSQLYQSWDHPVAAKSGTPGWFLPGSSPWVACSLLGLAATAAAAVYVGGLTRPLKITGLFRDDHCQAEQQARGSNRWLDLGIMSGGHENQPTYGPVPIMEPPNSDSDSEQGFYSRSLEASPLL
jgi:hypothetical protein